jgi:hypothetical protein
LERDTIFIGHANPEDNDFTRWLYSKLSNEGYKVACDLVSLTGGEADFWKELQNILDNQTCKYLLVFSKTAFQKQGVIDEWEQVRSLAKKNKLADFIYLLKYDDVAFDARIGTSAMNQFRFDVSWAKGLKDLMFKLDKDKVPKQSKTPYSLNDWLKNKFSTSPGVTLKTEKFYSNWLEIPSIPEKIFFYRYTTPKQAKAIKKEVPDFPIIVHDNYLITFLKDLPEQSFAHEVEIKANKKFSVDSDNAFKKYESTEFPNKDDLRRFFVRLLNECINSFMVKKGLHIHYVSNEKECFHYKKDQLLNDRVHFDYEGKRIRKDLVGDFFESFWHFGISISPVLYPILCFSIKTHLIFSDDGEAIWTDAKKMHKARRNKGKGFFNKEWRSLLLAFLGSLGDSDNKISIPISESFSLSLLTQTMEFESRLGYEEPKDKGRLVPLDYSEEDEEDDSTILESKYDTKTASEI